jgi:2-dehydropantoate 2-reductase
MLPLAAVVARSYAIIGTGALGGYYGARLHHAGCDVHFLLHGDYEHVRAHGLRVLSKDEDLSIARPQIYRAARDLPRCDVAAVCLKTTQNRLLPELLPPAVTNDGVTLMMQNGLGIEADALAVLPRHTILGGLAFLCSNKVGPGEIHHLDYGAVRFGEHRGDGRPAGITPAMLAVAADFKRAGIPTVLEDDLVLARWKKLVWNVPYNGMCVVEGCTTDRLMADPRTRARCEAIMREVLAIAAAQGRQIHPSFVAAMLTDTAKMAPYKPSMLLDFERGQPLELDAIYRRPLAVAAAAGIDCREIRALYARLTEMDAGSRA